MRWAVAWLLCILLAGCSGSAPAPSGSPTMAAEATQPPIPTERPIERSMPTHTLAAFPSPNPPTDASGCRSDRSSERTLTSTSPGGTVPLTVHVRNGITGAAVGGETVSAVVGSDPRKLSSLDLQPFFNDCVVAQARSDAAGKARFLLVPGLPYMLGHDTAGSNFTWELAFANLTSPTEVLLDLFPQQATLVWHGRLTGIDPLGQTVTTARNASLLANKELLRRLSVFDPDTTLSWNDTMTAWGDLYLGLAVGDGAMFTDDFFNGRQTAGDGPQSEDGFGQWIDYAPHYCESLQKGLTLVVYDAGPMVAPGADVPRVGDVASLPFDYRVHLSLAGPYDAFHFPPDQC